MLGWAHSELHPWGARGDSSPFSPSTRGVPPVLSRLGGRCDLSLQACASPTASARALLDNLTYGTSVPAGDASPGITPVPSPARFAKERKLRIWRDYVAPTANLDQKDKQFVAKVSGWQSRGRGRQGLPVRGRRAGCPAALAGTYVCLDKPQRVLPRLHPHHGPPCTTVRAHAGILGRPGVGRGETKRRGRGHGSWGWVGGCPGASLWLAGCCRDALTLPAPLLPAEGCLGLAEFSFPLLPAFPARCRAHPHGSPCPDPGGCCCGAVGLRGAEPLAGTSLQRLAQLQGLAGPTHESSSRDAPLQRCPCSCRTETVSIPALARFGERSRCEREDAREAAGG